MNRQEAIKILREWRGRMKYKKGDKFIIEIDEVIPYGNDKNIYRIKAGDSSLGMLTQQTLDKLEQVHERGGCDGCKHEWKKSYVYPCSDCKQNTIDYWTPKKTEEIQVGDEVENEVLGFKGVVYYINDGFVQVLRRDPDGPLMCDWSIGSCHRTGKTYPKLIKALEELPKEGE